MTKAEREKERYRKRKEQGICTSCGKVKATDGKTTCASCRQKQHEKYVKNREFFKSIGLCPKCGKNKLFGDEKNCPECNAKRGIYGKSDYLKRYYIIKRQLMDEKNLCISCCKKERLGSHIYCAECLERRNARSREIRKRRKKSGLTRSERPNYGMCYFCGDEVVDGLRVCERCRQRLKEISNSPATARARERMKEERKGLFKPIDFKKIAVN